MTGNNIRDWKIVQLRDDDEDEDEETSSSSSEVSGW
jgi:hypothetical protein